MLIRDFILESTTEPQNKHFNGIPQDLQLIPPKSLKWTFVYVSTIPHVGHQAGHYTPEYYAKLKELEQPQVWIGRPMTQVFKNNSTDK